jgi:sugar transferase (PEP-CTERM/EpsH1 system associated)
MKKALLHIVLSLDYGGLENIVYNLSKKLNPHRYRVHVIALDNGGPIFDYLKCNGVYVAVLGRRPGKFDLKLIKRLTKVIKQLKVDIIHSHSGCLMYSALAGRISGVNKIIHTEHGRYLPDSMGEIWEDRVFSRFVSKYVCVSKDLEEYLLSKVRVSPKKLVTIINGVDTSLYRKYGDEEILKLRLQYDIYPYEIAMGVVCRLVSCKNVGFLIEWAKQNWKKYKNLKVLIVGDGPEYKALVAASRELPSGTVQFLGYRPNIPDMLNVFDIFVLPSVTEGTSLTILEAMSTGLPVVVSDVGGNKHIVTHGETGFLFEVNNLDSFGNCLNKLLSSKGLREEIGRNARRSVEQKYSFEKMLTSYCELYG